MTRVAAGLARRGHEVVLTYDPRGPVGERAGPDVETIAVRVRNDGDPAAVMRLRRLIRDRRADIVCVNTVRELRVGGAAARVAGRTAGAGGRGARVVRRFGGLDALHGDLRSRLLYALLLDGVVRDSDWGVARVRRRNPWFGGPVVRARNGVDVDAIASLAPMPRAEAGGDDDEAWIGALGRVEHRKGSPELAAAAARVAAARTDAPAVRLVYIGRVDTAAETEIRRALAGSGARLTLLGERPPAEALRWLRACDVLAHPSHADTLCYAVLEGMAAGLPVVATRVGALPEAVEDGVVGRIVPVGDVTALADALGEFVADAGYRERMGRAAADRARRRFDTSTMLDEYEDAFRRIVAGPTRGEDA